MTPSGGLEGSKTERAMSSFELKFQKQVLAERLTRKTAETEGRNAVAERDSLVRGHSNGLRLSKIGKAIAKQISMASGATNLERESRQTASVREK